MLRTIAFTKDGEIIETKDFSNPEIEWYWVDLHNPTVDEASILMKHFQFHPLAIEDCFYNLQRPKVDGYNNYHFYVIHELHQETFAAEEVDLFLGGNYMVTFHLHDSNGLEKVWERVSANKEKINGTSHAAYLVFDQLVDDYFPVLYQIEDRLNEIGSKERYETYGTLMSEVFDIRGDLLKLRRTIIPMRDLLYRILNLGHLDTSERKAYFNDIYDHLLKLTELIESNREVTADMRDSYQTVSTNRMNAIMMTLTIVSTIFIPLTFIVGIYGMNFDNMPELHWKYGYFFIMGLMGIIVFCMLMWFKIKGWFNIFK